MSARHDAAPRVGAVQLVIERGRQQGACLQLAPGRHSVGSAVSSDIVLLDPMLAGAHFSVEVGADEVVVHAAEDMVRVDGTRRAVLAAGTAAACRRTTRFEAGGTVLVLRLPVPAVAAPRRRVWLGAGAAVLGAVVLTAAFATATDGAAINPLPVRPAGAAVAGAAVLAASPSAGLPGAPPGALPGPATRSLPGPAADPAGPLREVRSRLGAAGLDTVVAVQASDGAIRLEGTVAPAREAALREVHRWFDGAFGGRSLLVSAVRVASERPPLAVQAAWSGANPYVIDGGGQKLFLGARLADDWVIEAITADMVRLQRGSRSLLVHF